MTAITSISSARGLLAARVPDSRRGDAAVFIGAFALLVAAAIHVQQLVSIFHAVPRVGPLFAADALTSLAIAVLLLRTRTRLSAAAGALVSAAALAGLAWSSTVGLFGWQEATLRTPVVIAIAAEVAAIAVLVPIALPAPSARSASVTARVLAAAGLIAVGVLHIGAAGEEWADARRLYWLFIALAAACFALAIRHAFGSDRWSWRAVLALALLPTAGYVLSRTVGLPGDAEDVGEWLNPWGVAALAVQAALAVGSLAMIRGAPYDE